MEWEGYNMPNQYGRTVDLGFIGGGPRVNRGGQTYLASSPLAWLGDALGGERYRDYRDVRPPMELYDSTQDQLAAQQNAERAMLMSVLGGQPMGGQITMGDQTQTINSYAPERQRIASGLEQQKRDMALEYISGQRSNLYSALEAAMKSGDTGQVQRIQSQLRDLDQQANNFLPAGLQQNGVMELLGRLFMNGMGSSGGGQPQPQPQPRPGGSGIVPENIYDRIGRRP